jgi:hypothetical protein
MARGEDRGADGCGAPGVGGSNAIFATGRPRGSTLSLAGIPLFAFTHVAHEGGFELDAYSGISPGSIA